MRTLKLLTVTAMVAAALVLAPVANAQTTPTVTVTAGRPTAEGLVAIRPVTEGGAAIFTIALSEKVSDNDIEVAFELEETERVGEFVNSNLVNDGSEGSHTMKIRRGEDGAELVIRTIADGVHEDSEARNGRTNPLTLTLLPGPGYEVGTPSSATHHVTDDEAAWGTVGWESTEVTVAEEDGFVELAVTLSKPYSYPLTLRTSTSQALANSGSDYDLDSALTDVTIPAGSQRATVRVGIVDDDEPEDDERFLMALVLPPGLPVHAGEATATVTITDGDGSSEDGPGGQDGPGESDGHDEEGVSAVESCATWCVEWSAATLAEGEFVTMAVRDPSGAVDDSDQVAVTLHVGRTEGTADVDDIVVRDHAAIGQVLRVHPYNSANMHHQDGWVFIHGFFPAGEAKTRTMVVEALDNVDGVDSETLATWVYVNGELAGSQVLTITNGPQTQR